MGNKRERYPGTCKSPDTRVTHMTQSFWEHPTLLDHETQKLEARQKTQDVSNRSNIYMGHASRAPDRAKH